MADLALAPTLNDDELRDLDRGDTPWLLRRYRQTGDSVYGEKLVRLHEGLAISRANKMRRHQVSAADLTQVARMALWKAIRRYDPDKGASFATYAVRTIDGELKRYYRDRTWAVRVPRSLKERSLRATKARRKFLAKEGHEPSMSELAEFAGLSVDDLTSGLRAANAYTSDSLDRPVGADDGAPLGNFIPDEASGPAPEDVMDAQRAMKKLPEREQKIIHMRFWEDKTQREIADVIGVSQMHVSRLLRSALGEMRETMAA